MTPRSRRGVALFAALALTSVVGLLIAGAVATTRLMQHTWHTHHTDASLTMAADHALGTVLGGAHRYGLDESPLGRAVVIDVSVVESGLIARVSATRLPLGVLWLVADVSSTGADSGHRRVNVVARFPGIGRRPAAAIVARGNVELATDVSLSADSSGEADCASSAGASVIVAPGSAVTSADSSRVATSAIASDSASYFLTAPQLAALVRTGRFVHVIGDTTIAGGSFDGILIVDGSLTIVGPFTSTGVLVARGAIVSAGPAFISGVVMSFAPPAIGKLAIKFSGTAIRYSACDIDRALRRALDARAISQRSWSEIF